MRPLSAVNFSAYSSRIRNVFLVVCSIILTAFLSSSKLYNTAEDIPSEQIKSKATLHGVVVKVIDGDTFRLRHLPNFFLMGNLMGRLSSKTISVRIAAVDTPETAKFGKNGQPLGERSKKFCEIETIKQKVAIKLLSRDQYNRVIASVTYNDFLFSKRYF